MHFTGIDLFCFVSLFYIFTSVMFSSSSFSSNPSPSPSGRPVLLPPSLFVYLLIPVSARGGQSEDVCARQKRMMSSLSASVGRTGTITRHRYRGLHNATSFEDTQPSVRWRRSEQFGDFSLMLIKLNV